ncbi:hypothetical protein K1719_045374 [Acacia pycnantha]|nr:hypothetical protein K1719_045374 [Acacia pycnantha]
MDNIVEIHDLLQEMAEEIVREESREHPERRSRLNNSKEIKDMLKNSMGTDAIEGFILNLDDELRLSADAFKKMSNLRILNIENGKNIHLPDGFGLDSLYDKLSFFRWDGYPLKSLPSEFCAEKLVEIHIPTSIVSKLWDGVHNLTNLKTINLICCVYLVELPDLSMAQKLQTVHLQLCVELQSIHPSILTLPKLRDLDLLSCCNLRSIHGDNHMKSLKLLKLHNCQSLEKFSLSSEAMTSLDLSNTGIKTLKLPIGRFNKLEELYLGGSLKRFQMNELSCLTSLKIFSLSHFSKVIDKSKLSTLFDAWRSLEKLDLRYSRVFEIPDNISALSLLKTLSLRGCVVKSLPNSIKNLSQLKEIDLGQCIKLTSLPELPPSITQFFADGCITLETIDFKVMRAIYKTSLVRLKSFTQEAKFQRASNILRWPRILLLLSLHRRLLLTICWVLLPLVLFLYRTIALDEDYQFVGNSTLNMKRSVTRGVEFGQYMNQTYKLQEEVVEEMELKLENHRTRDSIRRSKRARQSGMPYFLRTRGMPYFLKTRGQQPKKRLRNLVKVLKIISISISISIIVMVTGVVEEEEELGNSDDMEENYDKSVLRFFDYFELYLLVQITDICEPCTILNEIIKVRNNDICGGPPITKLHYDFDFMAMNEKFNKDEVWGHLGKTKSHSKEKDGEDVSDEDDGQDGYNGEESKNEVKPVYNKDDFFDTLSCNSLDHYPQNGRTRYSNK